jgi:hypothetical protein
LRPVKKLEEFAAETEEFSNKKTVDAIVFNIAFLPYFCSP